MRDLVYTSESGKTVMNTCVLPNLTLKETQKMYRKVWNLLGKTDSQVREKMDVYITELGMVLDFLKWTREHAPYIKG